MLLNNIQARNFRNYGEIQLEFSPQVNFFYGKNGAGKTNILEAIQLVLLGDSFRTSDLKNITPKTTELPTQIKSTVTTPLTEYQLEFNLVNGLRRLLRDEKSDNQKGRLKLFSTVIFSPESLGLVKDEPGVRRRMLDRISCELYPGDIQIFSDVQKLLKMRNRILQQISENDYSNSSIFDHFDSLNEVYLKAISSMASCRIQALQKVQKKFGEISKKILQCQDVEISVDYVISGESAIEWTREKVYDAHLLRMQELEKKEKACGRSLVGPHKHDVRFVFNGEDARFFCSQGQQRVLALAIKIAQIESYFEIHNHYPVLLLDDVMSELDEAKRSSLVELLQGMQAQIFITTTDSQPNLVLENRQATLFYVTNGFVDRRG
jgi:DNA replication and repair protein RecF